MINTLYEVSDIAMNKKKLQGGSDGYEDMKRRIKRVMFPSGNPIPVLLTEHVEVFKEVMSVFQHYEKVISTIARISVYYFNRRLPLPITHI